MSIPASPLLSFVTRATEPGSWTLTLTNPGASTAVFTLTVEMHPDGLETERTWTTIPAYVVTEELFPTDGTGEILLTGALVAGGALVVNGLSTWAEDTRSMTVLADAVIGGVNLRAWTNLASPNLGADDNPENLIQFFFGGGEGVDPRIADALANDVWTLSYFVEKFRGTLTGSPFLPDEATIRILGGHAVVDLSATISSGLANGEPQPITPNIQLIGFDPDDGSVRGYAPDSGSYDPIGAASQAYTDAVTQAAVLASAAESAAIATAAADATSKANAAAGAAQTAAINSAIALVDDLSGVTDAATARSNLGLVIGTDVQAYDADLGAIAALSSVADRVPYSTGAQAWALATLTSFARTLLDDANAAAARTTLELGGAALLAVGATAGTVAAGDDSRFAAGKLDYFPFALGDETTAVTTGQKLAFRMPCAFTATAYRLSATTASTSGVVTVDVKKNGTSVFTTNLLTLDINEKTSLTATTACTITGSTTSWADDDELTLHVTVAGTATAGLKVTMLGTR